MSVSIYITFLKDRAYHEQMLKAARALVRLKVEKLPRELADYFDAEDPEQALIDTDDLLDITHVSLDDALDRGHRFPAYVRADNTDDENAIEIDLEKLPANVKHIRVSRS